MCGNAMPGACCMGPAELQAKLAQQPLHVRSVQPIHAGLSAPSLLTADVGEGPRLRLKWKRSGRGGDGHNRSPRHELAAWVLSQLLLGPDDNVVPPTAMLCLTRGDQGALFGRHHRRTFADADCELGVVSLWLEHVTTLHGLDRDRYARDLAYRSSVANLNLVAFVMDHGDAKDPNFVVTRAPLPVRVWAVDNGVSFSAMRSLGRWFHKDWSRLLVPSLPRDTVARLTRLRRADLERLAVVAQFEVQHDRLVPMPPSPPIDPRHGVRRAGNVIQLGLTRREIDEVARRISHVRRQLASGELAVFDGIAHEQPPGVRVEACANRHTF
jgi:hypothetical protein